MPPESVAFLMCVSVDEVRLTPFVVAAAGLSTMSSSMIVPTSEVRVTPVTHFCACTNPSLLFEPFVIVTAVLVRVWDVALESQDPDVVSDPKLAAVVVDVKVPPDAVQSLVVSSKPGLVATLLVDPELDPDPTTVKLLPLSTTALLRSVS